MKALLKNRHAVVDRVIMYVTPAISVFCLGMWVYYLIVLPIGPTNISGHWIFFAGGYFMLWIGYKAMRGDFDDNPDSVLHNRDRDADR